MNTTSEKIIIKLVLQYATQMNEIEAYAHTIKQDFAEYQVLYKNIFDKYVTQKKRVYGGNGDCYGNPTKYDSIDKAVETTVTFKTKNRAEVYFKTENDFNAEYLFIVLFQKGEWKIDSYKLKWYNAEKWTNMLL